MEGDLAIVMAKLNRLEEMIHNISSGIGLHRYDSNVDQTAMLNAFSGATSLSAGAIDSANICASIGQTLAGNETHSLSLSNNRSQLSAEAQVFHSAGYNTDGNHTGRSWGSSSVEPENHLFRSKVNKR